MNTGRYARSRGKPRWPLLIGIVLGHGAMVFLLARFLAPDFSASLIEQASRAITVTVVTYEEPPPEAEPLPAPPQPDPGAAGAPGEEAVPSAVIAPENPLPRPDPAPRAASTGVENQSGAAAEGADTGANGTGTGTGSGTDGQGRGGQAVTSPSVRSGTINAARDFPIPEGGRSARAGSSVTVVFTVTPEGRAIDCSIARGGPDEATNALVCPLVMERIRFHPARDSNGDPVAARYGWRQDFFRQ